MVLSGNNAIAAVNSGYGTTYYIFCSSTSNGNTVGEKWTLSNSTTLSGNIFSGGDILNLTMSGSNAILLFSIVLPTDPNYYTNELYYSTNAGVSWTLSTITLPTVTLNPGGLLAMSDSSAICIFTNVNSTGTSYVYYSTGTSGNPVGETWTLSATNNLFSEVQPNYLAVSGSYAIVTGTLFIDTDYEDIQSVWYSTDSGNTWTQTQTSFDTEDNLNSLAMSGSNAIVIGDNIKNTIYYSHGASGSSVGESWTETKTSFDKNVQLYSLAISGENAIVIGENTKKNTCHFLFNKWWYKLVTIYNSYPNSKRVSFIFMFNFR